MRPVTNVWADRLERLYTVTPTGCWEWRLSRHKTGYGQYRLNRKVVRAHRYFYEVYKGQIPQELVVHHKCFNRACVNPSHLDLIDRATNVSKAYRKPAH